MEDSYESDTLAVEDQHWWYRGRRRIVLDVVAVLPLPPQPQILDAGCGSGRNMVELSGFGTAVGLEPSSRGAEVARARGVGDVVVAGIDTMPFDDSRFDLITCLDVLEHIEDDRGALRQLRRVARRGRRGPLAPAGARGRPGSSAVGDVARLPAAVELSRRAQPALPPLHASR